MIDPELARVRGLRLAVGGAVLFFAAFGAFLLGSVLTTVWDKTVLEAGLLIAPGPLFAAAFSVPGARFGERYGHRAAGALGSLLFAAAGIYWQSRMGASEDVLGTWLPPMIVGGVGVGLVNPAVTGAAAAALPAARFATGAALLTMGRQIGSALGVAILIAVVGTAPGLADFHAGWTIVIAGALLAAVALASLGAPPRHIAVPVAEAAR